jgi:hypothetical protein
VHEYLGFTATKLGNSQLRRNRDVAVYRAGECGEALREDEVVSTCLAASRQPLDRAVLEIDRRGSRANDDLLADRAAIPQRLDSGLPTSHSSHLIEQQQASAIAAGEIERTLDGRNQLREMLAFQQVERRDDAACIESYLSIEAALFENYPSISTAWHVPCEHSPSIDRPPIRADGSFPRAAHAATLRSRSYRATCCA